MAANNLTAERVREILNYDPNSGNLLWRVTLGARAKAGNPAGFTYNGYWHIKIDRRLHLAHRVIWLHQTGEWPQNFIDHKDGNGQNNSWNNLRNADRFINGQNQRRAHKRTTSGLIGTYANRHRWVAAITANGKKHYLGIFSTAEEAHAVYLDAKRKLHGGCVI